MALYVKDLSGTKKNQLHMQEHCESAEVPALSFSERKDNSYLNKDIWQL
jgi:hypothetical protein